MKAVAKLPAIYIRKDFSVFIAMDMSGHHKNLASLEISCCELLGFNVGDVQQTGLAGRIAIWFRSESCPSELIIVLF